MKALLALIVMSGIYAMPHQSPMQSNDLAYSFDESTFLDRTVSEFVLILVYILYVLPIEFLF